MSSSSDIQQVCVIGIGNMGSALAEALIAGGHNVTVWNRTKAKCTPLAALGAQVAESATEAADRAEVIVICVLDDEANQAILSSKGMDAALNGKTLLQFTTLEPVRARVEAKWMRESKVRYIEGAILGFPTDVRSGSAQMVFSGSQDVFEDTKRVVQCLADSAVHVGEEAGKASLVALVVYSRYYGIAFACLHTAALAKAAGIPIPKLLDLTGGNEQWQRMGSVMDGYLEMVDREDYSTSEATVEVDAADYDMFIRLCSDLAIDPAHHNVISGILSRALAEGWGDKAIPAICEVLSISSNVAEPVDPS
jgi:3-hydroxyisobutyrate dehydrogenase-like beta-hydroxyacid dehydrogenase